MKPTHIKNGLPQMVDVTDKSITSRTAIVQTEMAHTGNRISNEKEGAIKASLTATVGTKLLPQFIPMTHPIPFTYIGAETTDKSETNIIITTTVRANWYTGMEVEGYLGSLLYALTFASHQDPLGYHFIIKRSMLIHKSGGKSGTLSRSIGMVKTILIKQGEERKFIQIHSGDPIFLSNNTYIAEKDGSYPLLIIDGDFFTAKGYIEIGPHRTIITYREIDDNGNYIIMLTPKCERAVIRIGHKVISMLTEEG